MCVSLFICSGAGSQGGLGSVARPMHTHRTSCNRSRGLRQWPACSKRWHSNLRRNCNIWSRMATCRTQRQQSCTFKCRTPVTLAPVCCFLHALCMEATRAATVCQRPVCLCTGRTALQSSMCWSRTTSTKTAFEGWSYWTASIQACPCSCLGPWPWWQQHCSSLMISSESCRTGRALR